MDIPGFVCKQTGECCRRKRVHVTLADVDRIARHLGVPPGEVLAQYLESDAGAAGALALAKDGEGWCRLNTHDKRCAIHTAKPAACVLYVCDTSLKSAQGYPWSLVFGNREGLAFIVERSIAQEVTADYVNKHGCAWDETGYRGALAEIQHRIERAQAGETRGARLPNDESAFIMFDCRACAARPSCCKDRPLTIVDIRAIAQHLGEPMRECFERYVSPEAREEASGLLTLRCADSGPCIFLDPGSLECTIEDARPMHCRFAPCPAIVQDPDAAERYLLGAGTLRQQFMHSIAGAVTRHYVTECGSAYNEAAFGKYLAVFDRLISDPVQFDEFRTSIAPYRFKGEAAGAG